MLFKHDKKVDRVITCSPQLFLCLSDYSSRSIIPAGFNIADKAQQNKFFDI